MKMQLSKRFKYEDYDLTEIDLDLINAPANILRRADAEIQRRKHVPSVKQTDTLYCGLVASYVTGLPYEVLEALPLPDFNELTARVSGFLLGSSEAMEDTTPPKDSAVSF
jgi:hypothetical protein